MASLELIGGLVTAAGAVPVAAASLAGNTWTIRGTDAAKRAYILAAWAVNQVAGIAILRSPRMHDNVQGIRFRSPIARYCPVIMPSLGQPLYTQDQITALLSGSAVAGDIEHLFCLIRYDDLPGAQARLLSWDEVKGKMKNIVTNENTIITGATGQYTGQIALNANFDLLKANTDYALLGYTLNAPCAAVRIQGVDFGNLGVGGPGDAANITFVHRWFIELSIQSGLPCIPVFNSANKAGILVDAATDENAGTFIINWILAEL
jgi:hypothetical protein